MAERLNVYELRDDLWKVAEKEAKKRPNISKEELKQKLTEHLLSSDMIRKLLPEGTAAAVEKVIGAVTEITIKTLEIYLREKGTGKRRGRPKKEKAKKAGRRKKRGRPKRKKTAVAAAPKKKAKRARKKTKKAVPEKAT